MTREEYIKEKIKELGFTIKSFAAHIEMPYTTLRSILNDSIGGTAVDNAIKICNGLGITINELQNASSASSKLVLSKREEQLVTAYRSHLEMQSAIDKLLGLEKTENRPIVKIAARSGIPIEERPLTDDEIEMIKNGEEWHGDDDL